jgi:hypothetical protein
MAGLVERFIKLSRVLAMAFWWDHDRYTSRLQRFDDPLISVVRLIRQQRLRFQVGQKRVRSQKIMDLARGQNDLQWITQSVIQNVEFAAQAAFASADRLIFTGFSWRWRCADGLA